MNNFKNAKESVEFYDARYQAGYMEEWDESKKDKVREIIGSLQLPAIGKALDFGCGNGVFTSIIKECLPDWEVYGVEISKHAVANARTKNTNCHFFTAEESDSYRNYFDFLFSHHVIEHVSDIKETFDVINSYLKQHACQFHILPCGNEGSLEFDICKLKKGGIEYSKQNRFFFEEPGHLRRLTSREFEDGANKIGFHLSKEYYANQYFGAINWITKSSPRFVKKLTSDHDATDSHAKKVLTNLRKKLLPLTYLQFPYVKYWQLKTKWRKSFGDRIKLAALTLPAIISKPFYKKLERKAEIEWQQRKTERNGSEMYLCFERL